MSVACRRDALWREDTDKHKYTQADERGTSLSKSERSVRAWKVSFSKLEVVKTFTYLFCFVLQMPFFDPSFVP